MKLSQCYAHGGQTYGPGDDVDVPEDFPVDNVKKLEKEFSAREAARKAEKDGGSTVNSDGLGVVQDAVDERGNIKEVLRNGKVDEVATARQTAAAGLSDDEIDSMTKAELEDYASSKNINLGDAKTKSEMVDAIKASR